MVRDGHLAKIPENMSFEEAATFGVGITTVAQTLYMTFKLPLPAKPAEKPFPILIYGGSTATGTIAIQYAKLYVPPLHIQPAQHTNLHPKFRPHSPHNLQSQKL
jgi:NADPH:quinone reductase-like Zn-dependent oxidoreductase